MSELIITNGDGAAGLLRAAGLGDVVLAWRDALHDGPVPLTDDAAGLEGLSAIRSAFLADAFGLDLASVHAEFAERDRCLTEDSAGFDRVTLWFEHDLYDQLQLIQVLAWFHAQSRAADTLFLVQSETYLTENSPERIAHLADQARQLSTEQLGLADRAWRAFRQPTPVDWAGLLAGDSSALPFLSSAVTRMLEELPDARSGLARTERQILRLVRSGIRPPARLFGAYCETEQAMFLGDWSFFRIVDRLAEATSPLIDNLHGGPFRGDFSWEERQAYMHSPLRLTVIGNEILAGKEDNLRHNAIDRWWGGTHLTTANAWRWDVDTARLVAPG